MIFLTFRFLAIAFDTFFSSQTNYLASVKHLLDFSMAPLPRFVLMQEVVPTLFDLIHKYLYENKIL